MHLALVIYGSLDEISGGFLYDRQLVAHLQQRGHRVTTIALPWRSYARSLADNVSRHLTRTLGNPAFDLILQDELVHPSFVQLNRRLQRAKPVPIVALIHLLRSSENRTGGVRRLYAWIERRYLGSVKGFIYVNRHIENRVHSMLRVSPPGVVAHPAGDHLVAELTPEAVVCRAQRPGPLEIIFVGNLTPLKGLHTVIAALRHLPAETWHLTVIGSLERDTAYVRQMRRAIKEVGAEKNVDLLGVLSHADVAAHLAQSDVFAVPSNPESYSIAYLEAMRHGLPIMAHAQSDSADLVEHGVSGFCIEPNDVVGLAKHLRSLAQNRQGLAHMSLAALKRAASLPTWEQSMQGAVQFLEHMAATHRG